MGVIVVSMNISEPPPLRSANARADTGSFWSSASLCSFSAENASQAVISLVSEAGSTGASAPRSASTWPAFMSTSRYCARRDLGRRQRLGDGRDARQGQAHEREESLHGKAGLTRRR